MMKYLKLHLIKKCLVLIGYEFPTLKKFLLLSIPLACPFKHLIHQITSKLYKIILIVQDTTRLWKWMKIWISLTVTLYTSINIKPYEIESPRGLQVVILKANHFRWVSVSDISTQIRLPFVVATTSL